MLKFVSGISNNKHAYSDYQHLSPPGHPVVATLSASLHTSSRQLKLIADFHPQPS